MGTELTIQPAPKSNKWAKGKTGNAKGRPPGSASKVTLLRQKFMESHGPDALACLLAHAYNDPATARWLATRLFGDGRWASPITLASLNSVEDCRAAMDQNFEVFRKGIISEDEWNTSNDALTRRFAYLEQSQP